MLGLERANLDLVLVAIVALAVTVAIRYSPAAGFGWIFFAGALKLYPFAAITGLISTKRSNLLFWITAGAEVMFVLLSIDDLRVIARATPQDPWQTFGYRVFFEPWQLTPLRFLATVAAIRVAVLAVFAIFVGLAAWRYRGQISAALCSVNGRERCWFLAGAAMFAGCFLAGESY